MIKYAVKINYCNFSAKTFIYCAGLSLVIDKSLPLISRQN